MPSWLRFESLASINFRETVADGYFFNAGDFSTHRTDAAAPDWAEATAGMTPNTTFANPIDNADLATDGYPWNSIYRSRFWELGVGVLFDVTVLDRTNLMLGGRVDGSQATKYRPAVIQRQHRYFSESWCLCGRARDRTRLGSRHLVERERLAPAE